MHIENIHIGDHVVITGTVECIRGMHVQHAVPWRVIAICAPFLAVRDVTEPNPIRTIDLRQWSVTKCDQSYVDAFGDAGDKPPAPVSDPVVHSNSRCPICNDGVFLQCYIASGDLPKWRCTKCKSTIHEGRELV